MDAVEKEIFSPVGNRTRGCPARRFASIRCSAIWRRAVPYELIDVSEDRSASVFRMKL